jgi:hypothetical protein
MAIIYSYPKDLNILKTDILIGSTTVLVNNKPKNLTRNFMMEDIADFITGRIARGDLTKINDTNVTLTLEGTPIDSLFSDVTLKLGWHGRLADSRVASAEYWNAKQNPITLTTNGVSGAATFNGTTLNIPRYNGQFIFTQSAPATTWLINHGLNGFPSVTIVNINNVVMYGDITYMDPNNVRVEFSAGFSGKAYLN